MFAPKVAFVVYGVHKDGLKDPMGAPFVDDSIIVSAKQALRDAGLQLVEQPVILATKAEARECFARLKNMDDLDAVILFSGTWVWSAHLAAAVRDYAMTGKGLLVWTHPGSQGWRPVGGLVLHGGLNEIGVPHRFVYGEASDPAEIEAVASYCQAAHLKNLLNRSTLGAFGGRGMGQTCGAADPSQWMKMFGVDIDSRDTTELIRTAQGISAPELAAMEPRIRTLFGKLPEKNPDNERSIRL